MKLVINPLFSPQEEFDYLGDAGHIGSIGDRQFAFLGDAGRTGALMDRLRQHALDGYPLSGISAIVDPTNAQELFVGEDGNDITNISTFTNTSNYDSEDGTIVSAEYQINGVNAALGTDFADGDVVSILVTDSQAATRRFTIDTRVRYGVDPTVSLTPTSDSVPQGTLAGSTLSTITLGNTTDTATLSGSDASLFQIVGDELRNVSDLDTADTFNVNVDISNSKPGSDSATFTLTVVDVMDIAAVHAAYDEGSDTATVNVAVDGGSASETLYVVAIPTAEADPTAQQIKDGQDSSGSAADWSDSGPFTGTLTDGAASLTGGETYRFVATLESAGGLSPVVSSGDVEITASGAFDPADLFAGGTRGGWWYDIQDFTNIGGATTTGDTPTSVGDKANYSFDMTIDTGTRTVENDGTGNYIDFATSGAADGMWTATGYSGPTVTGTMAVFQAIKTTHGQFMILASTDNNGFEGCAQTGAGTSPTGGSSPFGTPTYWTGATQESSPTRGDLHTAWAVGTGAGQGRVANLRAVTVANNQIVYPTRYAGGANFTFSGRYYGEIAVDNPTAQEITDIITYFEGLMA